MNGGPLEKSNAVNFSFSVKVAALRQVPRSRPSPSIRLDSMSVVLIPLSFWVKISKGISDIRRLSASCSILGKVSSRKPLEVAGEDARVIKMLDLLAGR